ncbi:MAG: tetratricopeptide repeat-containing sensor histidine kinase [Chloroherpetonaceae bacterium]
MIEKNVLNNSAENLRGKLKKNLQQIDEIKQRDPKHALKLLHHIREEASRLKLASEEAQAYRLEALCFEALSDFKQACLQAEKAIGYFIEADDVAGQASTWSVIANIYLQLGLHDRAFECNIKSLTLYERINDVKGIGVVLNNIGLSYFHLGDNQNARRYFEKALAHRQKHHLKKGIAYTLNNLASVCQREGKLDEALTLQQKSLDLKLELNDKRGEAAVLCNIASVYAELGQFKLAIELQTQSLEIEQTLGNLVGEAESLFELGKIYANPNFQEADDKKAIDYLHAALNKLQHTDEKQLRYKIHQALAEHYAKHRDFEKAYQHHCLYHELKEIVAGNDVRQKMQGFELRVLELEHEKNLAHYKTHANELTLLNHSLNKAIEMKSELIGIVTHDLSNPLQAISGNIELIRLRAGNPQKVLAYTEQIELAVNQMQERIHHWLKVVANESTIRQLGKKEISMNVLVRNVLETMRCLVEKKSQKITFDEQAEVWVMADAQLMYEVIENLVSNAIKYSPREKTIEVALTRNDALAQIAVKDEGEGLSEEDLKKLFGKFQTLSAKPTMGERSTGIGLFIAKQIVELHQGKIWAESEGKGKGATFFVQLPLHIASPKEESTH